jgi:hypothetical protein
LLFCASFAFFSAHRADWRSGNAVHRYLRGTVFESRPRQRQSWFRLFMVLYSPSGILRSSIAIRLGPFPSKFFPVHHQSFYHSTLESKSIVPKLFGCHQTPHSTPNYIIKINSILFPKAGIVKSGEVHC